MASYEKLRKVRAYGMATTILIQSRKEEYREAYNREREKFTPRGRAAKLARTEIRRKYPDEFREIYGPLRDNPSI